MINEIEDLNKKIKKYTALIDDVMKHSDKIEKCLENPKHIMLIRKVLNGKLDKLNTRLSKLLSEEKQSKCKHENSEIYMFDRDGVEGRTYCNLQCKDCGFTWEERYLGEARNYPIKKGVHW